MRALSRMELTVLGLVSRGEPCTAYWIRRQFQGSPSSHFSGSAGAVYPAVRRLEQQRLLRAAAQSKSGRKARGYALTGSGKKALQKWLLPPLPAEDVACLVDPVRTRVYYLEALSPGDRMRFVEDALAQTRAYAAVVKADCDARKLAGETLQHLGARGVLHEVRARIRWLEELRREL
jgi:DNA-binding PadR family transcriptional regulator